MLANGQTPRDARHMLTNRVCGRCCKQQSDPTCVDVFLFYMPVYGYRIGLSASTIGLIPECFPGPALSFGSCYRSCLRGFHRTSASGHLFFRGNGHGAHSAFSRPPTYWDYSRSSWGWASVVPNRLP